ncbi:hypothetical protein [Stappia indica]|uniref:hypothetical protein n=1 Tax=Stappia indica TaxID=538381 RepID=UPI00149555D9|nr:hypothetical protein [Stappia indica]
MACNEAAEDDGEAEEAGLAVAELALPGDAEVEDGAADGEAAPEEGVAVAGLAAAGPEDDEVAEEAGEAVALPDDVLLAVEEEAGEEDPPAVGFALEAAADGEDAEPDVELLVEPDAGPAAAGPDVVLAAGLDAVPGVAEAEEEEEGDDAEDGEDEALPEALEDAEAVFAAPTSLACRSIVTGLRPAPAAPLASVDFGSPAFGSADFEAVLLGSGFLLSAAMNGLSLGSFTGAGFRHGASIARPAASLPLTPLSMFAALAVQNKFAPCRVSPQAKKSFQRPHITPAARP